MSAKLLSPSEALRAEARAILDRLPPEVLEPVTEFLRDLETQADQMAAETFNHWFTSLSAELLEAVESVRAARIELNKLTAQLARAPTSPRR
jgi:hypothetical protein